MAEDASTLAWRVRHARKKRGLTQVALASLCGITQSDLSKIERGAITHPAAIARLCRALRVPSSWLEMGDGGEPDWAVEIVEEAKEPGAPLLPPAIESRIRALNPVAYGAFVMAALKGLESVEALGLGGEPPHTAQPAPPRRNSA